MSNEQEKKPYKPTEEKLRMSLDEIYYEIQQLLQTHKLLNPKEDHPIKNVILESQSNELLEPKKNRSLDNALLESQLIHVRNLVEMFACESRKKDNILAFHYGFSLNEIEIENPYGKRLHKDLAHLTYSRFKQKQNDKHWPPEKVVVPVLKRCVEFIDHILKKKQPLGEHQSVEWESLCRRIQEVVDYYGDTSKTDTRDSNNFTSV